MRFWDDMQHKFGFSDGEAVPDGAEVYRAVYIRSVNTLATQLGSAVRVVAYDRPGVHNWCLILFHQASDLEAHRINLLTQHVEMDAEVVEPDEAMEEAIRQACLIDLDSFVEVRVSMSDDFADFAANLRPVYEGEPLIVKVGGQPQHCYPDGRARLVHEVRAFDGTLLPTDTEYRLTWIDHYARLAALAKDDGTNIAIACATALVVTEIPAEVCAESENCEPIPPFHLRDMDDECLDKYDTFFNYDEVLVALRLAVKERGESIQVINGYSNTVTSRDPDEVD
jgi:hypothetical protein